MRFSRPAALALAALTTAAPLLSASAEPPPSVPGEVMLDLYLGSAFTSDSTVDLAIPGSAASLPADWNDSVEIGGRVGYWFGDRLSWLGLAVDASYFQAEADVMSGNFQYDIGAFTPLLMLRAPLFQSDEYPTGRFQPYVAAGAALILTELNVENAVSGANETAFDVGADVRAGFSIPLRSWVNLFFEYRFTHFDVNQFAAGTEIGNELQTHHLNGGLGFRFR